MRHHVPRAPPRSRTAATRVPASRWHTACLVPCNAASRATVMNLLAYPFYQWSAECLRPARAWAAATRATMSLWPPATSTPTGRMVDALCELLECCAF
ncbi:TPA: polyhydroxyalkanoate depolymerase, partial [Burkholderia cenocepacia]